MQQQLTTITNQIIRLKELVSITGLSRSTIYDKQNPKSPRFDPLFPKKVKLGLRAVGWFRREVESWFLSIEMSQLKALQPANKVLGKHDTNSNAGVINELS